MALVLATDTNPGTASWQPLSGLTSTVFTASATYSVVVSGNTTNIVPLTALTLTIPAGTVEYGDVIEYSWFGWFNTPAQTGKVGVRITSPATTNIQTVGTYTTSGTALDYLNVFYQMQPFTVKDPTVNPTPVISVVSAQSDLNAPGAAQPFVRWLTVSFDKDFPITFTPIVQWTAASLNNGFSGDNAFVRVTRPT